MVDWLIIICGFFFSFLLMSKIKLHKVHEEGGSGGPKAPNKHPNLVSIMLQKKKKIKTWKWVKELAQFNIFLAQRQTNF